VADFSDILDDGRYNNDMKSANTHIERRAESGRRYCRIGRKIAGDDAVTGGRGETAAAGGAEVRYNHGRAKNVCSSTRHENSDQPELC